MAHSALCDECSKILCLDVVKIGRDFFGFVGFVDVVLLVDRVVEDVRKIKKIVIVAEVTLHVDCLEVLGEVLTTLFARRETRERVEKIQKRLSVVGCVRSRKTVDGSPHRGSPKSTTFFRHE